MGTFGQPDFLLFVVDLGEVLTDVLQDVEFDQVREAVVAVDVDNLTLAPPGLGCCNALGQLKPSVTDAAHSFVAESATSRAVATCVWDTRAAVVGIAPATCAWTTENRCVKLQRLGRVGRNPVPATTLVVVVLPYWHARTPVLDKGSDGHGGCGDTSFAGYFQIPNIG